MGFKDGGVGLGRVALAADGDGEGVAFGEPPGLGLVGAGNFYHALEDVDGDMIGRANIQAESCAEVHGHIKERRIDTEAACTGGNIGDEFAALAETFLGGDQIEFGGAFQTDGGAIEKIDAGGAGLERIQPGGEDRRRGVAPASRPIRHPGHR